MRKYGLSSPKLTVADSWKEWVEENSATISGLYEQSRGRTEARPDDIQAIRESKYLSNLVQKLGWVKSGLEDGTWIFTGTRDKVEFKPVRVDQLGSKFLWPHGKKWLLMSATVISADEMLDSLGWQGGYRVVNLDSTFPVENRRVIFKPTSNMSKKGRDEGNGQEEEKLINAITQIARKQPLDRILIHTVSYELSQVLRDGLREIISDRPILSYQMAADKDATLARFLQTEQSILCASSMDRGIDLPGDACRVQVIVKIPWPYLGDKQIAARKWTRGGEVWYVANAIRSMVQMTGRAVRSEDDWAINTSQRNP